MQGEIYKKGAGAGYDVLQIMKIEGDYREIYEIYKKSKQILQTRATPEGCRNN